MNQHYDPDNENNYDDFEKRLSAISLVTPSATFQQIPARLASINPTSQRSHRLWPALTGIAIAVALVGIIAYSAFRPVSVTPEVAYTATIQVNTLAHDTTATGEPYVEGKHYNTIPNPISYPDSTTTQVSVFFWYPCWPCASFEETLTAWERELGSNVILTRRPAIWSANMQFHAQAFYTAVELGIEDEVRRPLYLAFRKDDATISDEEDLQLFFEKFGVSAAQFRDSFHSPQVQTSVREAGRSTSELRVQSTPSLYVAGKYAITPVTAGGLQEMLDIADFLIEKERPSQ